MSIEGSIVKLRNIQSQTRKKSEEMPTRVSQKQYALDALANQRKNLYLQERQLIDIDVVMNNFRADEAYEEQAFPNFFASFGSGSGGLVETIGKGYGLATGDMENAWTLYGKKTRDWYQKKKPRALLQAEKDRKFKVDNTEGELNKSGVAFWESITNPDLAIGLIAENLPNYATMGGVGMSLTKATGSVIAGTTAAISTGASLQGSDIGGGTYERIMALPKGIVENSPEYKLMVEDGVLPEVAKHSLAMKYSRTAGGIAFIASLASQALLPGIPKVLASGGTSKITGGAVGGAIFEGVQEYFEEGSGALAENFGVKQVDPTQELTEDVGERAGIGAAGGTGIGFGVGLLNSVSTGAKIAIENKRIRGKLKEDLDKAIDEKDSSGLEDIPVVAAQLDASIQINQDGTSSEEQVNNAQRNQNTRLDTIKQKVSYALTEMADLKTKADTDGVVLEADRARYNELQSYVEELSSNLNGLEDVKQQVVKESNLTPDEIDAMVEGATEGNEDSKSDFIFLAMHRSDSVDDDQLNLFSETDLNNEQQEIVDTLIESRRLNELLRNPDNLNSGAVDKITSEILTDGIDGFTGLETFKHGVENALAEGNLEEARRLINRLKQFEQHHSIKGQTYASANQESQETGKRVYVTKDYASPTGYRSVVNDKNYVQQPGNYVFSYGKKTSRANDNLIRKMSLEKEAITALRAQLEASLKASEANPIAPPVAPPVSEAETTGANVEPDSENTGFVYKTDKMEITVTPTVDGEYTTSVSLKDSSSQTGYRLRNDLTQTFETKQEAEDHANKIIGQLERSSGTDTSPSPSPSTDTDTDTLPTELPPISVLDTQSNENELPQDERPVEEDKFIPEIPVKEEVNNGTVQSSENEESNKEEATRSEEAGESSSQEETLNEPPRSEEEQDYADYESEYGGMEEEGDPDATSEGEGLQPKTNEEGEAVTVKGLAFEGTETSGTSISEDQLNDLTFDILSGLFTQRENKGVTRNPLLSVADWSLKILTGQDLAAFLPDGVNSSQVKAVKDLIKFKEVFGPKIQRLINSTKEIPKELGYLRTRNLAGLFSGKVDDNLQMAFSYATAAWLAENIDGQIDFSQIKAILRMDNKDNFVDNDLLSDVQGYSQEQTAAIMSLGKRIADAYGLQPTAFAPNNFTDLMIMSLGEYALIALQETVDGVRPVIEKRKIKYTVSRKEQGGINSSLGIDSGVIVKEDKTLVALKFGKNIPAAYTDVTTIFSSFGNTQFLEDLFGVTPLERGPNTAPESSQKKKGKGEGMPLDSLQQESAKASSEYGYTWKESLLGVHRLLSREIQERIAGVDLGFHVPGYKPNVDSRNRGLLKELDQLSKYTEIFEGVKMYLTPVFWSNNRAGYHSNQINPQSSKIHRSFMAMDDWSFKVNPSDAISVNTLKLGIAAGLDLAVDKNKPEVALRLLEELMENPVMKAGIEAINVAANNQNNDLEESALTPQQQQAIAEAVELGGENFHSLDALVAWDALQTSELNNESFISPLMFEIDGLVNGPALALISTGTITPEQGYNAGFYDQAEQTYTNYRNDITGESTSDSDHNLDLYETFVDTLKSNLSMLGKKHPGQLAALENLMTGLRFQVTGERNVKLFELTRTASKTPIQSTVFGAGNRTAISNLAQTVLVKYYEELGKIGEQTQITRFQTKEQRKAILEIVQKMNSFLGRQIKLPVQNKEYDLNNLTLSSEQVGQFKDAFYEALKKPMKETVSTHLGAFQAQMRLINDVGLATWTAWNNLRTNMIERKRQELIKTGALPDNYRVELPTDVLAAIDQELSNAMPKMGSPSSTKAVNEGSNGNARDTGLLIGGNRDITTANDPRERNKDDGKLVPGQGPDTNIAYQVTVALDKKAAKDSGVQTEHSVRGNKYVPSSPDAGTFVKSLHSMDAFISHLTQSLHQTTNIHDAVLLGVGQIMEVGETLNKNTFEVLVEYSMYEQLVEAINAQQAAIQALAVTYGVEFEKDVSFDMFQLEQSKNQVEGVGILADLKKLDYLKRIKSVGQYVATGAEYQPTPQDRRKIRDKIKALEEKKARRAEALEIKNLETAEKTKKSKEDIVSAWGEVGKSESNESVPALAKLLEESDGKTIVSIKEQLKKVIRESRSLSNKQHNQFLLSVLNRAIKGLPSNTTIMYITPERSNLSIELYENADIIRTAFGFYAITDTGPVIGIKSPDFKQSGITPELIVHEILHGATQAKIAKSVDPDTRNAVAELEKILAAAKEFLVANPLAFKAELLTSVDELISYGLSNSRFQTEVLAKIEMPVSETTLEAVGRITGLSKFIGILTKIFFGTKTNDKNQSALGSLIYNAAIVMEDKTFMTGAITPLSMNSTTNANDFSTLEIFQALSSVGNPVNVNRSRELKQLLETIVDTVYGSTGALRAAPLRNAPQTADDIYLNSVAQQITPFSSKFVAELNMTNQEGFVGESLEVTLKAMMALPENAHFYKQLRLLFAQAKKEIKATDLHPNPDRGQAIKDLIFTIEGEKQSDYLSQFMAASLTFEPLKLALDNVSMPGSTMAATRNSESIVGKVFRLLDEMLDRWRKLRTGVITGSKASATINDLATKMAHIEKRKQDAINNSRATPFTQVEAISRTGLDKATAAINSAFAYTKAKSLTPIIGAVGGLGELVTGGNLTAVMSKMAAMRNQAANERLGLIGELMNEADIGRLSLDWAVKMSDQQNKFDQERKSISSDFAEFILNSFVSKPTDDQLTALTRVILRADISALENIDAPKLLELLESDVLLNNEIVRLEDQLKGNNINYLGIQAKGLGYRLATGRAAIHVGLLNAHNIASSFGTNLITDKDNLAENTQTVDQLATLYAIQELKLVPATETQSQVDLVIEVLRNENNRTDDRPNAMNNFLTIAKSQREFSEVDLFDNNPTQMQKGYIKETINSDIKVIAADEALGAQLIKAGYTKLNEELALDPHDNATTKKALYVVNGAGLSETVGSFFSVTDKQSIGTELPKTANKKLIAANAAKTATKYNYINFRDFNVRKETSGLMTPLVNENGKVANFRYTMSDLSKDSVLGREIKFHKVIGAMEAAHFDKLNTPELNRQAIVLMKVNYDAEHLSNPEQFIRVSADARDPVIRDRWRTLPKETKRFIRQTWKENGMWVRKDVFNIAMGYRKYSTQEILEKTPEEQSAFEKVFASLVGQIPIYEDNGTVSYVPSKRAIRWLQAGNVIEDSVKTIKDIWVIKNLITLMGNESSNMTMLVLQEVPLKDIVAGKIAWHKATDEYIKDRKVRDSLQRQVDHGVLVGTQADEAKAHISMLNDSLARSRVSVLIDQGLYQTLIEDIDRELDPYNKGTQLMRFFDEKTSKVPSSIKTVGRWVFMTHDTPLYQGLNKLTMYSDFTSRGILFEHLVNRETNPLSHSEAIRVIRDSFVNYDIPTHRGVQWLNDKGLVFFTKYYIRIQLILLRLMKENPLRAAAIVALNSYLNVPTIVQSSILTGKLPFQPAGSITELPGASDDIITIAVARDLLGGD